MTKQEKYYQYIVDDLLKNTTYETDGEIKVEWPFYPGDWEYYRADEIEYWADMSDYKETILFSEEDYLTSKYGLPKKEMGYILMRFTRELGRKILPEL